MRLRVLFSFLAGITVLSGLTHGQSLIYNGDFEANYYLEDWVASGEVMPFGGLAAGSTQGAAIGVASLIGQNVATSPNWFLEASIAIKPTPGGNPAARLFSLLFNIDGGSAGNAGRATINLRYQEGKFDTYNGATWVDTGLGSILPSVDANGDGDFDDPGDTKNVYRIRVTGSNWGGGAEASSYFIQLSDANGTDFVKQTGSLRNYQVGSGDTTTPGAFLFNSIYGSNPGFYVDDVVFEDIELPDDPDLAVISPPPVIKLVPVGATTATGTVTVRNNGATKNLTLTGATFTGTDAAKYSANSATAAFPITLAPGETADVQVNFNSGGLVTGSFSASLELASNDSGDPASAISVPVRLFAQDEPLLSNGGFESDPYSEGWSLLGTVEAASGLSGSNRAVKILGPAAGGEEPSLLGRSVVSPADWRLEASFLTLSEDGRTFQIALSTFGEPTRLTSLAVDLRYEDGVFSIAQPGGWSVDDLGLGALVASVDGNKDGDYADPGDEINLYRIRLTGRAWGSPEASLDVELTEPNGTTFTRGLYGWNAFPGGAVSGVAGPPVSFQFPAAVPEHVGMVVDNVTFLAGLPGPVVPPATDFEITAFTVTGNAAALTWDNRAGGTYKVESSPSLQLTTWTALDSGLPGPAYNFTLPTPAPSPLFYRVVKE